MANELLIERHTLRLSKVVKEHRPAQFPLWRHGGDSARRMLPDIKAVMRIALVKAHAGQDLGNRHPKNIRKCKQRCPHVLTEQELVELRIHALVGNVGEQGALFVSGAGSFFLRRKAEHRAKAHEAQNAQRVLFKAPRRFADAAEDTRFQIFLPAERIDERTGGRKRDGVDRKIAPGKVFFNARAEGHGIGVAVVPVCPVAPHGRQLNGHSPAHDRHRTVLQARRVRAFTKNAQHLLRRGVGGHVVIARLLAAQHFAHAAADKVGRIPRVLQRSDDSFDFFRQNGHKSLTKNHFFSIALRSLLYYNR